MLTMNTRGDWNTAAIMKGRWESISQIESSLFRSWGHVCKAFNCLSSGICTKYILSSLGRYIAQSETYTIYDFVSTNDPVRQEKRQCTLLL